ncbi:ABC transporter permease [Halobiforma nitratireducens]|uniref:Dipeptide/oligopeptide/nickel ABC transporter permease n=1 Tax=Halobiforma nitratireducens JCM 10879 TaxID=1227454 RepID=M0LGG3_9EURY|nr:ABC transporter permease [Halobiforma nitratireducens]EMA31075.1 dipeptide/oligopeptide/nickel ABC transporter permease [Halobiforma nitratireducens JCM 10879]
MKAYIAKRIAWTFFATWVTLTITFLLLDFSPISAAGAEFVDQQVQQGMDADEARELYQEQLGHGDTAWERYTNFMVGLATFDWGWSSMYSQPVVDVIANSWIYSFQYVFPATVLSVILGFAIGLYSATHQYTKEDYAATLFAFTGISLPNFWFAIMLILIFATMLGWLPTYYSTDVALLSLENAKQLILPVIVLSTAAIASEMRYARAESLEYVHAEFVKTARAKGLSENQVTIRHIFRPAMVPLITILVGDILGLLFAGGYVIEVIFQIPGLGLVSYEAIIQQDTPLVLATVLIPVFIAIIGNLVQDICYTILDPRIDFGDR